LLLRLNNISSFLPGRGSRFFISMLRSILLVLWIPEPAAEPHPRASD
jgi:hypothetical protein